MDGEFVTTAKLPWGPAAGVVSLALSLAATAYNVGRMQPAAPAATPAPVAQVTQAAPTAPSAAVPMPYGPYASQAPYVSPAGEAFAANVRLAEAQARGMTREEMLYGVRPEGNGTVEIKATGKSRVSTVGPAPEPPKVSADIAPAPGYHDPYFGAPLYQAPNYYERACYAHANCRGYSRCQYGSGYKREEPLLPFGSAGHKSDTSYGSSQRSGSFRAR